MNINKKYTKVCLIVSCIFAVIASVFFVVSIFGIPQAVGIKKKTKYLYENGIEVDAYFKYYYDDYHLVSPGNHSRGWKGNFHIVYEYVADDNRTYTDEYRDAVVCRSREELRAREQYIKQLIATERQTMKMLIADNGLCCLSVYKETLLRPTTLITYSIMLPVASVVLGFCIFGIVIQSKNLRRMRGVNYK